MNGNVSQVDKNVAVFFFKSFLYRRIYRRHRGEVISFDIIFGARGIFLRYCDYLAVVSFGDVVKPAVRNISAACHDDPEIFHNGFLRYINHIFVIKIIYH